jgi:hypothetical protein
MLILDWMESSFGFERRVPVRKDGQVTWSVLLLLVMSSQELCRMLF